MGRKSNAKRDSYGEGTSKALLRDAPNWPLLALSLVGCALAGYLTWTSMAGQAVQGCTAGSGCDVVLSSRWATLFDMPTAFWGFLSYATLAGLAFVKRADTQWRWAWTIALLGVLYSVYLTIVSLTILGGACPYCLTSLALMTAIFALLTIQRPALPRFSWQPWITKRAVGVLALIGLLHLNYTGVIGNPPSVEDPVSRALAVHLADTGVKMYGAYWCPHCTDQKDMFGPAQKRLPYIECSTGGPGTPQTAECRTAGIASYPTWDIKGQRYAEVLSLVRLAELTGFDLTAAAK
ncbi:MAG: vitamin K epoxide reductase family protein [Acidobacteria bacterium]|nr:vitamin K epoxide reductase family protein [Acidobacteriota bacterium]